MSLRAALARLAPDPFVLTLLACAALASLNAAGEAITKDTSRALQLYTKACDTGFASA